MKSVAGISKCEALFQIAVNVNPVASYSKCEPIGPRGTV